MEIVYETKLGKLYYGDAYDSQFAIKEKFDLVFTDPPYPKSYQYCYNYLAYIYADLMKSGASLFTIVGHYALNDIMNIFRQADKLKFRWIFDLDQESDQHPRMAMGIEVCWKPMLWYVKDKFPRERNYGFMRDKIIIPAKDKTFHEWQQNVAWCYNIINKVTKENELVCDPFMGSGTVALACEMLNRRWIGIDKDLRACNLTIGRLMDYENSRLM